MLPKNLSEPADFRVSLNREMLADLHKKQSDVYVQFDMPSFNMTSLLTMEEDLRKVIYSILYNPKLKSVLIDGHKRGFFK